MGSCLVEKNYVLWFSFFVMLVFKLFLNIYKYSISLELYINILSFSLE